MTSQFGLKTLYDVKLKCTSNREINGRHFEKGETLVSFKEIQIANIKEVLKYKELTGGWRNAHLISWKGPHSLQIQFANGVFTEDQLTYMVGGHLVTHTPDNAITIAHSETVETDENGNLELSKVPKFCFFYRKKSGEKVIFTKTGDRTFAGGDPFTEYVADYEYEYSHAAQSVMIGNEVFKETVSLEGKTRIKDDTDGRVRTGIIKIPCLEIVSSLSFTLGEKANPVVPNFMGIGHPVGPRNNQELFQLAILDDNIDSDV